MLYLLDKDVRTVKWNGVPLHEASSAIVKEEVNGDFILTVRYPITDSGVYQLIKEDMLIKAPVPVLGAQLFRIKKPVENDDSLDITAYHISDDVMQRSINPLSVVGQGCAMALSQMVQNAKTDLGTFSFTSDIMDSRTFNTTDAETLYSVLLDGKHSIVGTWEGELVRDNFALSIKRSRGADRGVVITTHKNLKSYQRTKNSQNVVTRIHVRSTFRAEGAETDTVLTVTVDSPLIGNYPYINEKEYENNDAKTIDELRKWAEAKFKHEGIDKISDAIEIEAYELDGQVIHLGDTVNIKSRKHDVDLYKKAIAYEYNALTEEYISITFDDKPGVGGSGVSSGVSNAADVILNANRNAQEVAIERAVKNANQAFDAEFEKRVEEINDGIEQSKAEAEAYADTIKQQIDGQLAESDRQYQQAQQAQDQKIAESLRVAGASTNLANTAKTLAEQAKVDLNLAKQSLSGQIALVSTQASQFFDASREETARQVAALRLAVTQDYVAKSVFEETARGISRRFESLYVGGTNLLTGTDEYTEIFNSEQSHAEFLRTPYDLAPVFDKYGLIEYTLSFDLRASQAGQVVVYQQNGSGSKYSGLWKNLTVTTEWQRFHVTFTPTEGTMSLANSYLAFYGTYGTGVKPIIRRTKIERGAIATDWSLSPEDATNYADTKIAEYRNAVDGRFANLQASVDSKANLVDFQTVKETAQLYERIIGSTETGIKDKVARMVMADSLFLTEVKDKISGTATQVSQLNNSYAIKNLTSAGTVLNQINLLANGTNRIDGRLTHITGQTLIDNGVIKNAMIGELDAGKITSGTVDAARIKANSIDGSKIAFDEAFFNGLSANQAYLKKLFAKDAFLTAVQAVNLSAKQIAGGIAKALNGGMDVNFDESKINFYTNVAAIRRIYTGHPTQFIKFETEGNYSRTIIGSNRNGGEVFNSATFAGIVVENTNNINTEDNVRLYGDNTLFRHAQGDVGWNINSVTQRIVPANINAESEIWSKHFVAPDKNSKPVRLDTAVAALWDIWNHIIYNNFEFNEALRTHIKARRDNWKFELNL
ncbi:phage tail spike protein [Streptococcus suis]|uniref:phage tail spike protein n=1 Tax=Streptococcus suis TaxID=1307 RepID=UPI002AB4B19B|nr:phage tail spike protein [Streptococcus suis]MDY7597293.1 phage tail spike protein [Streptococcus suis]